MNKILKFFLPVLVFSFLLFGAVDTMYFCFKNAYPVNIEKHRIFLGEEQKLIDEYVKKSENFLQILKRCKNQFAISALKSSNDTWLFGKNGVFYSEWQTNFFINGTRSFVDSQTVFDEYAQKISVLESLLKKSGKSFLFLITASKAEIYPEFLPWQESIIYKKYGSKEGSQTELLKSALQKYNVTFYDVAPDIRSLKKELGNSIYYPTGIHWSLRTTAREANTILSKIDSINIDSPVKITNEKLQLYKYDREIFWKYPVLVKPKYDYRTPELTFDNKSKLSLYMYGTSFLPHLAETFFNSADDRLFNRIIVQEYFRTISTYDDNGYNFRFLAPGTAPDEINLYENIQNSDIVIMEQQGCMGLYQIKEPHNRFLDYLIEKFSALEVE